MAITVKHSKVSTIPDGDDPSVVRPSDWNADHTLVGLGTMAEQDADAVDITGGTITGVSVAGYVPTTRTITAGTGLTGGGDLSANRTLTIANTGVIAASYGSASKTLTATVNAQGQLTALADTNIAIANTQVSGLGTASTKDAGVALGVATLDASGKVPLSEIPDSIIGALSYQGTWNALTNTPTLTSSVGTKGYYYVVNVAGTTDLNGITDWQVGDWAVYSGTAWQKIDNTDGVTSVNGLTGAVVLTTTNIAEGTNEYFTTTRARNSVSAGTGISYDNSTGIITNSAPDQTVSLTAGTGISTSGTYPNFTITNTAPSLGGDVVGPASATDNAIARFDTTTGKLIQNSVVTVSDTGAIAGATTITDINYVDFNTAYATTLGAGQMGWNGYNTLGLGMMGGNVIQHIGEDTFFYVKASSAITKGQLCMFTGAVGSSGVLTAAPSNSIPFAEAIMGIAAEDIALNDFGLIQITGTLKGVDTSAFADGDVLYYNSAVTGGLTATYPASGPIVIVAAVANASSGGSGVLTVRVSFQTRVSASTGISVTQTNNSATISNTGVTSLIASTGISVSGSTGSVTVTNTAPDQTVSITGAGTTTVTGTYPNFTVTSNDQYTGTVTSVATGTGLTGGPITTTGTISLADTAVTAGSYTNASLTVDAQGRLTAASSGTAPVTSVGATAPIASSGGTTPTISISQATTSTNGYLSSTDWNTFNGKANAFTYTTSYIPFGQGTTTPNQSSSLTYASSTLTAPVVSASNGLVVNSNTVSASYSIPSGSSAMSVGPMTVASGQTVTVPTGGRWVVL